MAAPARSVPNEATTRLADPALREALVQYARRRLPPGEVEDLVQNTLTEALVASNAPSGESEFLRWVRGIARHKVADSYRRRGRLPVLDAEMDAKQAPPAHGTEELEQWILRELPKTDNAQATLHWLLRESDGESLDDIARDAALPPPRVRQRVSRLRRHFHARWLALGAAGLALLIGVGLLFHYAKRPVTVPPIAQEPVKPLERVRGIRQRALERCAAGAFDECVARLDEAKLLDPLGDSASVVQDARAAAMRAAQPAPSPPPSNTAPETKAVPKLQPANRALDQKRLPSKALPQKKAYKPLPSKDAKQAAELFDAGSNAAPRKP